MSQPAFSPQLTLLANADDGLQTQPFRCRVESIRTTKWQILNSPTESLVDRIHCAASGPGPSLGSDDNFRHPEQRREALGPLAAAFDNHKPLSLRFCQGQPAEQQAAEGLEV